MGFNDPIIFKPREQVCTQSSECTCPNCQEIKKILVTGGTKPDTSLKYGQNPNHVRPSWDEYFIEIMQVVSHRGTCDRGRAAAVLVKDRRIISTGYVGAPMGIATCDEVGHLIKESVDPQGNRKVNCIRTTHAEANAIALAAREGVATEGATMYCRMEPCLDCAKLMINAGVKKVIAQKRYQAAETSREFLRYAGVELVVLEDDYEKGR